MHTVTAARGLVAAATLLGTMTMATESTDSTAPVRRTILDNGLTVLIREDHSAPVVSAQAWCRAGSITEGKYMGAGISHVLEHMLFKGTTTRGVGDIPHAVDRAGGDMNAYTSFEQTVYHIDLPAENWQTAVDILADCMMNATIPPDELLKEKQVILREMAMGVDDPGRRADRLQWNTAFIAHPYRHPVIGYPDIYNRITRDEVFSYYKQMYVPNNLIFIVVGDVKAAVVEAHLRELTRDFKMNAVAPATIPVEPPQVSRRERHEDAPIQLTHLDLAWHVPAATDPDVPALDVLAIIAGQGRSSRLYREVQQNQGLVHSIGAGNYTPGCPGLFGVGATTDPGQRDTATAAILAEIHKLQTQPVSAEECRKAIQLSLSDHYEKLKTMAGQAADIGSNELLVGDPNYSEKYLAALRRVTPVDVQRVANKYLTDDNLTVTSLDPTGTNTQPAKAPARQAGIAIQKFDLPNGLRLLVREDHKLPFVDLGVFCKGGVLTETAGNNGITKLMARMLLKGTPTRTAAQIADSIESVGGGISTFSGNNSFGVTAHALRDDLDLALDLLADVVEHPTFPDDMLARERDVQLSEIKAEQDQVLRSGQQLLRETLYARHPYRLNTLGTPATVAKLTRAELADYQRRYIVPNNMVVTIFGDVTAAAVRQKIAARFGALQPGQPTFATGGAETLAASAHQQIEKPKEQAALLIGFSTTDMFNPDRYVLDVLSEAYSGLGSRLFVRLRDELSLCYYCGAFQLAGVEPGFFAFYVGTTAPKVELCEKEILAELAKLKATGLTADQLDRAKASLIGQRTVALQDNGSLAMTAGLDELYGLGYQNFQTTDAKYRAITPADIQRVVARYFSDKPYAVAVVRPATKAN